VTRLGHKVDYDLEWTDKKKTTWEMIIGKFAGPPFVKDPKKDKDDKHKLLRTMKDVFDLQIETIINISDQCIDEDTYRLIQTLEVYGILSLGMNFLHLT